MIGPGKGKLDNVYASGFNDSGLYIGACRDCDTKVSHALIENNALGYSGTNSGGHLVVQHSTFRHNSNGVGPNSLNNDDKPPPQDGACSSGTNTSDTPTFPSTNIKRCTVFKRNVVDDNSNFSTPAKQAEYELQRQQTLAKAKVAEAEGDAQATLVKAKAQAEANKLLQQSLTALLIQNKAIERWNGTLPQFTGGGAVPFLNLKDLGGVSGEGHSTAPGH